MHSIPKDEIYVIGTFLSIKDLVRLSITSKHMANSTKLAINRLAKREVMRLFSSNLDDFRYASPFFIITSN